VTPPSSSSPQANSDGNSTDPPSLTRSEYDLEALEEREDFGAVGSPPKWLEKIYKIVEIAVVLAGFCKIAFDFVVFIFRHR
jgi:hypothetical protein